MSEGDNHTAKPIHAWEDEYVTKPKLNLYMSDIYRFSFGLVTYSSSHAWIGLAV
jgi:hypothetical protein